MRLVADVVVEVTPNTVELHMPGAVDMSDGRVAYVGSEAGGPPAGSEVSRVGGLLMPGLVNSHAHTPMTLLRSVGDGLDLHTLEIQDGFPERGGDEDVARARLVFAELRGGVHLGAEDVLVADP